MELRHLRSFCVVAEEGQVTRAAKRLNIAQPALTQQIKALEADLGIALLQRVGRGIQITPAGRILQKEAQGVLEHVKEISDRARDAAGKGRNGITVGISDIETVTHSVTDLLENYRKHKPDVLVREVFLNPKDVASALRDGRVDAAFSCVAVPDRHDLTRYRLRPASAVVAVPQTHPFATKPEIRVEDLASEPLILFSHGEAPGSFEAKLRTACTEKGFTPLLLDVTPSMLIALNMVASKTGIAILPGQLAGLRSDAVAYIPLKSKPELLVDSALYLRRKERAKDILALKDFRAP